MKIIWILMAGLALACSLASCARDEPTLVREGSARSVLRPLATGQGNDWRQRTAYVPVYSSIYWGFDRRLVDLSITLTIRNTSTERELAVRSVRYYDSAGKLVRSYVDTPSSLPPMAAADFVIQQRDTAGGIGASFRIETASQSEVDDALIEAVMIGQNGNAGVSFTTVVKDVEPEVRGVK